MIIWQNVENHGKDPRLKKIKREDLDDFEVRLYDKEIQSGRTHGEALQLLINTVESDYSQLPDKLAEIAKQQDKEAEEQTNLSPEKKSAGFIQPVEEKKIGNSYKPWLGQKKKPGWFGEKQRHSEVAKK